MAAFRSARCLEAGQRRRVAGQRGGRGSSAVLPEPDRFASVFVVIEILVALANPVGRGWPQQVDLPVG